MTNYRKKHVLKEMTTHTVSPDGEVSTEIKQITSQNSTCEPNFIKMYTEDIGKLMNCTKGSIKVLNVLLKNMTYENIVRTDSYVKEKVRKEYKDFSTSYINNCISELKRNQILISTNNRAVYIVNPKLFGKGKWKDINNLRMTLFYNGKGRSITIEKNVE